MTRTPRERLLLLKAGCAACSICTMTSAMLCSHVVALRFRPSPNASSHPGERLTLGSGFALKRQVTRV